MTVEYISNTKSRTEETRVIKIMSPELTSHYRTLHNKNFPTVGNQELTPRH